MSTAVIAVIVHGVVDLAGIGAGLTVVLRLAPRRQNARGTAQQHERAPESAPRAPRTATVLNGTRTEREAEFARHVADGKSPEEAGAAIGLAAETARKYERRRAAAQDGAET